MGVSVGLSHAIEVDARGSARGDRVEEHGSVETGESTRARPGNQLRERASVERAAKGARASVEPSREQRERASVAGERQAR